MRAAAKISSLSDCCPAQSAKTGLARTERLRCARTVSAIIAAISRLDANAVGEFITKTASTPGSSRSADNAKACGSGPLSPRISTGLVCDQLVPNASFNFAIVASESVAILPPKSPIRSTASWPSPPPFVKMPIRSPVKGVTWASVSAAANNSSRS